MKFHVRPALFKKNYLYKVFKNLYCNQQKYGIKNNLESRFTSTFIQYFLEPFFLIFNLFLLMSEKSCTESHFQDWFY